MLLKKVQKSSLTAQGLEMSTKQVLQLTPYLLVGASLSLVTDTRTCHCIPRQPANRSFCLGQTFGIFPTKYRLISEQSCKFLLISKLDSTSVQNFVNILCCIFMRVKGMVSKQNNRIFVFKHLHSACESQYSWAHSFPIPRVLFV